MANIVKIKRSTATNIPAALEQGEVAYSEDGSPNGEGELFIGTAGATVTKITTTVTTGTDGVAAQPNSSAQNNQTVTTGVGIDGADGGSTGNVTLSIAFDELPVAAMVSGDWIAFDDAGTSSKALISAIPLSLFNNDVGWTNNTGTVTAVLGGVGLDSSGGTTPSLSLNFTELADMTGGVSGTTEMIINDAGTESRKAFSEIELSNFNNNVGWTTNTGTVTSVTGGTGVLSSGGVAPAISLDYAGADNFINSAPNLEGTGISTSDTLIYHDATDDSIKKGLVSDLPFGVGSGDISRVNITAGTGLSGTQDTLTGDHTQTLNLDFSSLTDMTAGISGSTEFILQNGTVESRKSASEINLSNFNNDSGWTTNTGTVTSVAGGTGIASSGGNSPSLSLDFSELADLTSDISGSTEFILQDGVAESRKSASEIKLSFFNNNSGWEANDPNEVLTTDTGSASWNWIIDEDAMGSNSNQHVPTQQSVKAYVDNAVSGGLTHKGGYNAATNVPALDTGSPSISVGDMYTVTAAGTFFTEALEVGDVLIADVDSADAAQLSDWTLVQKNIGAATETEVGYIELATQAEMNTATDDTRAVTPLKYANSTIDGGTF